jgi:hypothetical protein
MTRYCSLCNLRIKADEPRSAGGTWHQRCAQQTREPSSPRPRLKQRGR